MSEEQLNWKKKSFEKIELVNNLQFLINSIVSSQIQEISSKIECLCSMGIVKDKTQIDVLKEKIKKLQQEMKNGNIKP